MTTAPPQLSPDGQWWWDGQQWIPAARATAVPAATVARGSAERGPGTVLPGHGAPAGYGAAAHGTPAAHGVAVPGPDGKAVASLVLGLLWLGGLGSLAAVVLGHLSRGASRRQGASASGLATAGLVLGYLGVVTVALLATTLVVGLSAG